MNNASCWINWNCKSNRLFSKSKPLSLVSNNPPPNANILRAAFAGELVQQDPNDEPASVLLECIRAERAERAKQPKTRRTKPKEIATVVSQLIDVLAGARLGASARSLPPLWCCRWRANRTD